MAKMEESFFRGLEGVDFSPCSINEVTVATVADDTDGDSNMSLDNPPDQDMVCLHLSDEQDPGDGRGRFQRFEGGSIYWTPQTGAWTVRGAILEKWGEFQWEQGFVGYPMMDEVDPGDGRGRFQNFEGGQIYWTPETGAHEVHGPIFDKWGMDGWQKGKLGYPVTDIMDAPGKDAVYCEFENGRIDWNPMDGAKVTYK